jgi:hypothetical protein
MVSVSLARLKELPHDGQSTSINESSWTTSIGFWQCGQRICME